MMGTQALLVTETTTIATITNIQETTDYSIFKLLKHNRPVVQSHVAHLAQSMADRPHLRPARPVLCNEDMEIIDGQHREAASRMNGQSVFFMVVPGLTIEDARLLNALQRTWSVLDYAYSYASSGTPAYVQFIKAYEARELPPTVIMEAMMGQNSRARYDFRIGLMQAVDNKVLNATLDKMEDIIASFGMNSRPYVVSRAISVLLRTEGYDHGRMIKKLEDANPQAQPDRVGYVRELERIYNSNVMFPGPNYLKFY